MLSPAAPVGSLLGHAKATLRLRMTFMSSQLREYHLACENPVIDMPPLTCRRQHAAVDVPRMIGAAN